MSNDSVEQTSKLSENKKRAISYSVVSSISETESNMLRIRTKPVIRGEKSDYLQLKLKQTYLTIINSSPDSTLFVETLYRFISKLKHWL